MNTSPQQRDDPLFAPHGLFKCRRPAAFPQRHTAVHKLVHSHLCHERWHLPRRGGRGSSYRPAAGAGQSPGHRKAAHRARKLSISATRAPGSPTTRRTPGGGLAHGARRNPSRTAGPGSKSSTAARGSIRPKSGPHRRRVVLGATSETTRMFERDRPGFYSPRPRRTRLRRDGDRGAPTAGVERPSAGDRGSRLAGPRGAGQLCQL
jgi:hypothetical protein